MAIMAIMRSSGFTRDQYDALRPKVQWEQHYPDGAIFHSCAIDPNGEVRVVDVWESAQQFEAFFKNRLAPVMQELDLPLPQMDVYTVHNLDAFPGIEQHVP